MWRFGLPGWAETVWILPEGVPHDDVRVALYANADSVPPGAGGLPATVKGNEVFPDTSGSNTSWIFDYTFVLQFGDGGRVGTYKYATHRWVRCRTRGGGKVYAPRRLIRVVKPQPKRLTTDETAERNFVLGNASVTWDFVSKGLGSLRKKFK